MYLWVIYIISIYCNTRAFEQQFYNFFFFFHVFYIKCFLFYAMSNARICQTK